MRWMWGVWIELKIGMEKDAMCVLNEGLKGMKGVADGGWSMLVWGSGG